MPSSKTKKIFQDSVQGIIEVGPIMLRFIDTVEFQRLRRLHQLSLSNHIYPNCTHTRFEHCLGTYHLAKCLVDAMEKDVKPQEARLSRGEGLSIMIAALCHDLGHGPLSHAWEHFLQQGGPRYKVFKHEEMSCLILRRIVAKDEILQKMLEENDVDVNLVCALIRGHPTPELAARIGNRKFIFEIVSNEQNGIDVDKWDYIMRDSMHAGLGQGASVLELGRMLQFYRPSFVSTDCAWHMAFRSSERDNVFQVFSQRLCLRRKVYTHKTACILESMYLDIFNALDRVLNLRELSLRASNGDEEALSEFIRLDEHSLWAMALVKLQGLLRHFSLDIDENLRRYNQLYQRIQFRQLYSLVGKFRMSKKAQLSEWRARIDSYNRDLPQAEKLFLDAKYAESQSSYLSAFDTEALGGEDKILSEIFAKLPRDSPVKSVNEFRLSRTGYSTNSTQVPPVFFAYNDSVLNAYSFSCSYAKWENCLVLWTGPSQVDDEIDRSLRGPAPVPACLTEAFEAWMAEKRAASA